MRRESLNMAMLTSPNCRSEDLWPFFENAPLRSKLRSEQVSSMGNREAGLEICARFMRNLVGANKCNFSGVYIVIKKG